MKPFHIARESLRTLSVAEAGEECDGTDLAGHSCAGLSLGGGSLSCTGSCEIDYSGCDRTFVIDELPDGTGHATPFVRVDGGDRVHIVYHEGGSVSTYRL